MFYDEEKKAIIAGVLIYVVLMVVGLAGVAISAKMESDTYNRLTGSHTTWWDAMWVELRVMEPTKQEKDEE